MILYLDTSVLVTAYTREPETLRILEWVGARREDELVVSEWVRTEFASALSNRIRAERMTVQERSESQSQFDQGLHEVFSVLAFRDRCFADAREWVTSHKSGLRSGDALHLAIAHAHGAVLCTRDRRFAEGARLLGMRAELL